MWAVPAGAALFVVADVDLGAVLADDHRLLLAALGRLARHRRAALTLALLRGLLQIAKPRGSALFQQSVVLSCMTGLHTALFCGPPPRLPLLPPVGRGKGDIASHQLRANGCLSAFCTSPAARSWPVYDAMRMGPRARLLCCLLPVLVMPQCTACVAALKLCQAGLPLGFRIGHWGV